MLEILKTYLYSPFIFSLILVLCTFLKNPIHIRRLLKAFFFFEFILIFVLFSMKENTSFNLFSQNCFTENSGLLFLFIFNFLFLILSIISKTFITKLHKPFSILMIVLFGLGNFALVLDNIFVFFISIFWIFLTNFFMQINFCKKEDKKSLNVQLFCDILLVLICAFLINYDFSRYFILNNIPFNYTTIPQYIYKLPDEAIVPAFVGFLILIFRLLNLSPLNGRNLTNSTKSNSIAIICEKTTFLILGSSLLLKTYLIFDYLFYKNQEIIAYFLIFNLVYYTFLSLRQDSLIKFLNCSFGAIITFMIFTIFSFKEDVTSIFGYCAITTIVSYCFIAIIFSLISQKQQTDNIFELKKINDSTKLIPLFLVLALLNFSKVPLFVMFQNHLIAFVTIFSIDYDDVILNIMPYVALFSAFILSICGFNLIGKILIEPTEIMKKSTSLSNHQIIVLTILLFALIIVGFFPQYIIENFSIIS